MESIPRIYTADFSGGREIKTHVFQKCWNGLISRNYKWSGRVKKHSNLNSQTSSKTLQELFFSPEISCSRQSLYKAVSFKWAERQYWHWHVPSTKISGETDIQVKSHLKHHMEHCLARRLKQPVGCQATLQDESQAALGNTEAFTLRSKEKTTDQARSHHANSSAFSDGSQQKNKTCLSEEELFFKRHTTAMQRGVFIGQKHDNPVIPEILSKENLDN